MTSERSVEGVFDPRVDGQPALRLDSAGIREMAARKSRWSSTVNTSNSGQSSQSVQMIHKGPVLWVIVGVVKNRRPAVQAGMPAADFGDGFNVRVCLMAASSCI